jgi:hypothetical protein
MNDKASEVVELGVGRRLRAHWRSAGDVALRPGATSSSIASFENSNRVILPPDLRDYFEHVDGFDQETNSQDARGFNFWPLKKLARVSTFDEGHFHFGDDAGYFLFCDYMDFSWGYAISLKRGRCDIVLVGTASRQPKRVAKSFSEFAAAYLRDDDDLYV